MKEINGKNVILADGELKRRENANRDYLMRLKSDNLLLNYRLEAARPTENFGALPQNIHGGWEFPTCQLRGHFLGHWLSAAAMHYHETGDAELKAKADAIVAELYACQRDNGGEWAASIPEKYFTWIGQGRQIWAPHYTVHKTFMGLLDMYRYAGNRQALEIADRFADWFFAYSGSFSREAFDDVLDFETGGMLEIWAILLEISLKQSRQSSGNGIPHTEALAGSARIGGTPGSATPGSNIPGSTTPGSTTPGSSITGSTTPGTSILGTATPRTGTSGSATPGTDTPGSTTPGNADSSEAPYALNPDKYRTLLNRYYRSRLFDRLLAGEDPLTNMHANTTIPEVIGCAKAYEVTGDEKWRRIVEAYWKCAVKDRGTYATGGQTLGEVWTPKMNLSARLGDRNQEHCTVYNMMRLAEFLLRWTKDASYADYMERNLYNGLMAQTYWEGGLSHGLDDGYPHRGLVTYFLPMRAGGRKGWASETEDFFCCHGTAVQANAALNRGIYYQEDSDIYVCQYFDSSAEFTLEGEICRLEQKEDRLSGSFHLSSTSPARQGISGITSEYADHPDAKMLYFAFHRPERNPGKDSLAMTLHLRVPEWNCGEPVLTINGEPAGSHIVKKDGFICIDRMWREGDTVGLLLKKSIRLIPLPGDEELTAFSYGPEVLAGLCDEEISISLDPEHPEKTIVHDCEREWGAWHDRFKIKGQGRSIRLVPIREVGYEKYTVYFSCK